MPDDALHLAAELRDMALVADAAEMAALVLLTGCLPGHAELRGYLRPAEAWLMAVSMSIASSVSASSRSVRTCLICSSNSTSDSWVTRFGGLDRLAGA